MFIWLIELLVQLMKIKILLINEIMRSLTSMAITPIHSVQSGQHFFPKTKSVHVKCSSFWLITSCSFAIALDLSLLNAKALLLFI
jgi:hypothetical protein